MYVVIDVETNGLNELIDWVYYPFIMPELKRACETSFCTRRKLDDRRIHCGTCNRLRRTSRICRYCWPMDCGCQR